MKDMLFPESFIDQLVARCDIHEIVSRYVSLKSSGSNHFGLCPFHKEKTPSFSVNTDKQIYHCFGCGAGGGVINFIMQIERLEFADAVEFLANIAGLALPEQENDQNSRKKRKRMLELYRDAARFYHAQLAQPAGAPAAAYFERRALTHATIAHFGLGYSPEDWDALLRAMTSKGYEKTELLEAGLVLKNKTGGLYDRFRNRVMFPIIDVRGEVIAFGGRVLDDSLPKYLNSPDTPIFNKSKNLFALNFAKHVNKRQLILAEGYMDVIALHQAGYEYAVASLGTSLTTDQARLMKRYAEHVVIAYDADGAGKAASNRAIEILKAVDVSVRVLRIPGAKDPDEFIKANGAGAFQSLLDRAENDMEYKLLDLKSKFDLHTDDGRVEYLKQVSIMLAEVDSPVEQEVYARRAAQAADITPETLLDEVKRVQKSSGRRVRREEQRKSMSPANTAQPRARTIHYTNVKSAMAEEGVNALLLADSTLCSRLDSMENSLLPDFFSSDFLGKVYAELIRRHREGLSCAVASLAQSLSAEEMERLTQIAARPLPSDREKALADYIDIIMREKARTGQSEDVDPLLAFQALFRDKKGYGGTKV